MCEVYIRYHKQQGKIHQESCLYYQFIDSKTVEVSCRAIAKSTRFQIYVGHLVCSILLTSKGLGGVSVSTSCCCLKQDQNKVKGSEDFKFDLNRRS